MKLERIILSRRPYRTQKIVVNPGKLSILFLSKVCFVNTMHFTHFRISVINFGVMLTLGDAWCILFMRYTWCVMLDRLFNNLSLSLWRIYRRFQLVLLVITLFCYLCIELIYKITQTRTRKFHHGTMGPRDISES